MRRFILLRRAEINAQAWLGGLGWGGRMVGAQACAEISEPRQARLLRETAGIRVLEQP